MTFWKSLLECSKSLQDYLDVISTQRLQLCILPHRRKTIFDVHALIHLVQKLQQYLSANSSNERCAHLRARISTAGVPLTGMTQSHLSISCSGRKSSKSTKQLKPSDLPRSYYLLNHGTPIHQQLYAFADGSDLATCIVIYTMTDTSDNFIHLAIVTGKSKLLKMDYRGKGQLLLPRAELNAAEQLVRLVDEITKEIEELSKKSRNSFLEFICLLTLVLLRILQLCFVREQVNIQTHTFIYWCLSA